MKFETVPLKHLAAIPITNGVGEAAEFDDPTWPRYVRTTDIGGPRSLRDDTFRSLPPEVAHRASLEPGDIVMTAAGATIGKSLLYGEPGEACYAGYLVRFRPKIDVDGRFISYWMESDDYWDQIAAGKVVSTIENFSAGKYQNLKCPAPSPEMQRAIADYLDTETARINALIIKKQNMMELLKERRRGLITFTVTGDANPQGGGVRTWPRVQLKHVARLNYGDSLAAEDRLDGSIRVFGSNGPVDVHDRPNTLGPVLVVGRKGSYGKIQYSTEPVFAIDTTYFIDASTTQHNLRWLYYALSTLDLDSLSQDVGVPGLSRESAYEQRVPLPSPVEQNTISEYLDTETSRIDAVTVTLERQITLHREQRKALIAAAVTGELEIPGAAA